MINSTAHGCEVFKASMSVKGFIARLVQRERQMVDRVIVSYFEILKEVEDENCRLLSSFRV